MPGEDIELRRRRAAYRASHRGTKEMDWLLGRYALAVLSRLEGAELVRFERLLAQPDPDLYRWILDPSIIAQSEFASLIIDLRRFHGLGPEPDAGSN
jgi:antitoxin CptB